MTIDHDTIIHELSAVLPRLLREMPAAMWHALENGHVLIVDHDSSSWIPSTVAAADLSSEATAEIMRVCDRGRMPVLVRGLGDEWAVAGILRLSADRARGLA